jgi:hypothetical protein
MDVSPSRSALGFTSHTARRRLPRRFVPGERLAQCRARMLYSPNDDFKASRAMMLSASFIIILDGLVLSLIYTTDWPHNAATIESSYYYNESLNSKIL